MPLNFVFTDYINRENETPLHETSLVAKALAGANVVKLAFREAGRQLLFEFTFHELFTLPLEAPLFPRFTRLNDAQKPKRTGGDREDIVLSS